MDLAYKLEKGGWLFFLYYVFLLLVMVSWNDETNLPPMLYRFGFTFLVVIPLFLSHSRLFPAILTLFVIVSAERHAASYMMFQPMYVAVVAIVNHVAFKDKSIKWKIPPVFLLLLVFCTLSDLVNNFSFHEITFVFISIILFGYYTIRDNATYRLWTLVIILIGLMLAIDFHIYGKNFVEEMLILGLDYERYGWSDPNYFSSVLCISALLSYFEIVDKSNPLFIRFVAVIVFFTISIAMITTASRGALLALGAGVVVYTLFTNTGISSKIIVSVLVVSFLLFLQSQEYFELLEARLMADDGTGSGRTEIWQTKIDRFFALGNPLHILFGYGYEGGRRLGYSRVVGFHNDFIAAMVEYGIVGLLLLISLFVLLIKKVSNKSKVFSLVASLLVICMTLESLTSGRFVFWFYLLYIYLIGHSKMEFQQVCNG